MKKFIDKKIKELKLQIQPAEVIQEVEKLGKNIKIKQNPKEAAKKNLVYITNLPEPKILSYFFLNYGNLISYFIEDIRVDYTGVENVRKFLVYLESEYEIQDQFEFLTEVKKHYEFLLKDAENFNNLKIKSIQFKYFDFTNESNYSFLFRNFYEGCLCGCILKETNKLSKIVGSIFDQQNFRITKKVFEKFIKEEINRITEVYKFINTELNNLNVNLSKKKINVENIDIKEEKIIWKKDKKDLVSLINILIENEFIVEHKTINKLISKHFAFLRIDNKSQKIEQITPLEIADLKSKLKNSYFPLTPSKEIVVIGKMLKNL